MNCQFFPLHNQFGSMEGFGLVLRVSLKKSQFGSMGGFGWF